MQVAGASSSSIPPQPTFKSKPTNYLHLFNEHSSIKGEYVIDPGMNIPTSLLPPLRPEESEADRKNLSLRSKHGSVNAEIWLLGARDAQPSESKKFTKRAILDIGSDDGSVTARVVCRLFDYPGSPLIRILAHYSWGCAVLAHHFREERLCECHSSALFSGFLLLTTSHGSVSLTDTLSQNCTHLSQVDLTRRYFVGDLSTVDDSDWIGDELRVEAKHGNIRIKYVEEHTKADNTSKGGLLNRLFGW
ncbi:uncharacterized protein BJ212DRAFT_494748 [Suillus subaureus]|uniref:DUF7330 domain-containing protein n=1 Tax=Suillus subaureus TaxID=48587 RepID=A0A9P7JAK1_9AGAM|nr:uncharacterized protein BJ212DRAFT_494748 [Suillus subaureus]KAG1811830.1 hypothetical protein BJ212DRAFT_494748 [Suillus subaureus]